MPQPQRQAQTCSHHLKRAISLTNVDEINENCSEGVKNTDSNVDQADGSYWPTGTHIQNQENCS